MNAVEIEQPDLLEREQVLRNGKYYWPVRRFQDIVLSVAALSGLNSL